MGFLKSLGEGLTSSVGSLLGGIAGAYATKKANDENIAFQREQNAIERERADNTLMRTVADAHRAGLSAFDAQPVPLGQTSAPLNDVSGVSSSMGSLTASLGQTGSNALSYALESAKLEHNKNVDDQKLKIADAQASADISLKNAETEIANLNARLQLKENLSYDERLKIENDLKIAQTKASLASESKQLAETSIAYSREKREKALHDIEVNARSIEYQMKIQQFNHNAEYYPAVRDFLNAKTKLSNAELVAFAKKLDLTIDNLTLDALNKIYEANQKSYGTSITNKTWRKMGKKYGE